MPRFTNNLFKRRPAQQDGEAIRLRPSSPSRQPNIPFPDGIQVLHDCANATVDICFIHGLTGNRDTTWTAKGQSQPWPQTLLAPKLDKARILTYGYDVYVVRNTIVSSNRLIDDASNLLNDLTTHRASASASDRPIIFIAHGLGGLVCKEAILTSGYSPEIHLKSIYDCIKETIFIGTPHTGSWMADWAKVPAEALEIVKSTDKSLLQILEAGEQYLESM